MTGWGTRRWAPFFDLSSIGLRLDELAFRNLERMPPEHHTAESNDVLRTVRDLRSVIRSNPALLTDLPGWVYHDEEAVQLLVEAFKKKDAEERSRGLKNEI